MQTKPQPPVTAPDGRDHRWTALVVIAIAQLMVALDATVVNIALPTAQGALGFSDAERAWVVTAYTSAVAGLLLLGGRLADRIGRRRAFLYGLVGFAVSSALAGAAPSLGWLIAGRALQGSFAAVLTPTALSLIAVTFTDGKERAKAFGVYGAVASSGAAVGLLLGGVLTEYAGWRWCLFVNVAIALVAFGLGRRSLPDMDGFDQARIDVVSGVLASAGLATIVYGCAQAAVHGWGSTVVLAPLAAGCLVVGLFLKRQRGATQPILPLWVLADGPRLGAYLSVASAVVGSFGMFLMLTYHFQAVLGWSPVRTGLAFLPLSVAVSVGSFGLGSRLLPRVAPRPWSCRDCSWPPPGSSCSRDSRRTVAISPASCPPRSCSGSGWGACSRRPSALPPAGSTHASPEWLRPPPTRSCRWVAQSVPLSSTASPSPRLPPQVSGQVSGPESGRPQSCTASRPPPPGPPYFWSRPLPLRPGWSGHLVRHIMETNGRKNERQAEPHHRPLQ